MAHRLLILGGGTGGTLVANRLQRLYGEGASITVIDRDDAHIYQPGAVALLLTAVATVAIEHRDLRA